jgi:hypothetical protein
MGKKKKYNSPKDPIKAMKKASRDLELEMGVRFTYNHPHKSKKQYNRKNKDWKKDIQSLIFFFLLKPYIRILLKQISLNQIT